jgi:hypothetical protein
MLKNNIVMGAISFVLGVAAGTVLLPFLANDLQSDERALARDSFNASADLEQTSARMIYRATALIEKVALLQMPAEELPCELWDRARLEHEIVVGSLEHFSGEHPEVLDGAAGVMANDAASLFATLGDQYEVLCLGVTS